MGEVSVVIAIFQLRYVPLWTELTVFNLPPAGSVAAVCLAIKDLAR